MLNCLLAIKENCRLLICYGTQKTHLKTSPNLTEISEITSQTGSMFSNTDLEGISSFKLQPRICSKEAGSTWPTLSVTLLLPNAVTGNQTTSSADKLSPTVPRFRRSSRRSRRSSDHTAAQPVYKGCPFCRHLLSPSPPSLHIFDVGVFCHC